MKVLLIGGGGREHALAWAIGASPLVEHIYCAPGNAGIAAVAKCVSLDVTRPGDVIDFCRQYDIGFVVVGPEAPLVAGLADDVNEAQIKVFGPSKAAAQLEGSKGFTKDLCSTAGIPTAAYAQFDHADAALAYLETQPVPIVIKADGLAAGKGVVIAETREHARAAVAACFDGAFGSAGASVVIEAFLVGEEASFFVLCDGKNVLPLATAQDHKRIGDGDTGPNTGGMGAYSPAPVMTAELCAQTLSEIIEPTVGEMARRGTPFKGVLYAGLMITDTGPQLIEYNVRFGDPECQALMMRLKSDIVPALLACADGVLANVDLRWHDDAAMTIVVANDGYPGPVQAGAVIGGLEAVASGQDVEVFHAGTAADDQGRTIATGGRVLGITARGTNIQAARDRAYAALSQLDWPTGFYRRDIGWRALNRDS